MKISGINGDQNYFELGINGDKTPWKENDHGDENGSNTSPNHIDNKDANLKEKDQGVIDNANEKTYSAHGKSLEGTRVDSNEVLIPESWFTLDVTGIVGDDPLFDTDTVDKGTNNPNNVRNTNKRSASSPLALNKTVGKKNRAESHGRIETKSSLKDNMDEHTEDDGKETTINTCLALTRLVSMSQDKARTIKFLTNISFLTVRDWKEAGCILLGRAKTNKNKTENIISEIIDVLESDTESNFTVSFEHIHLLPPLSPTAIEIALNLGLNEAIYSNFKKSLQGNNDATNVCHPRLQQSLSNQSSSTDNSEALKHVSYSSVVKRNELESNNHAGMLNVQTRDATINNEKGWTTVTKRNKGTNKSMKTVDGKNQKVSSAKENLHIHIRTPNSCGHKEVKDFLNSYVHETKSLLQCSSNENKKLRTWYANVITNSSKDLKAIFPATEMPFGFAIDRYHSRYLPTDSITTPKCRTLRLFIGNIPSSITDEKIINKIRNTYEGLGAELSVTAKLLTGKSNQIHAFAKVQIRNPSCDEFENLFTGKKLSEAINSNRVNKWRGPDPLPNEKDKHSEKEQTWDD